MLLPAGVEEALFKPTANGWIFSAPNPWTFARRRSYLIDDAQKADLALGVRRGHYYRMLALVPVIVLPYAALLLFPSLFRAPSVGLWLSLALFGVAVAVAINLSDYFAVRSLLVGLPRTTEHINVVDMHRRQARSMSVKALATLALIETVVTGFIFVQWLRLPRSDPYMLIGPACFGLIAMLFIAMLVAKLRSQRNAT
jgi:hypothetical protein